MYVRTEAAECNNTGMNWELLTRRKVLASLGAAGAASAGGVGGLFVATEPALAMEHSAQVQTQGNDLELSWKEIYNGETIGETDTEDRPRISLSDVKPGDTGSLTLRCEVVSDPDTSDPQAEPEFTFEVSEASENGVTEPEAEAEDEDQVQGSGNPALKNPDPNESGKTVELLDYLEAEVFYDSGLMGINALGAQNGNSDLGETFIERGTFRELDGTTESVGECLTAGQDDSVTITFNWEFTGDGDRKVNAAQTDTVLFDITVGVTGGCDGQ